MPSRLGSPPACARRFVLYANVSTCLHILKKHCFRFQDSARVLTDIVVVDQRVRRQLRKEEEDDKL